jgi:hypothetical protein
MAERPENGNWLMGPKVTKAAGPADGTDHDAVLPPFTAMTWPAMNEALAEATKTKAWAISKPLPIIYVGRKCCPLRAVGSQLKSESAMAVLRSN